MRFFWRKWGLLHSLTFQATRWPARRSIHRGSCASMIGERRWAGLSSV